MASDTRPPESHELKVGEAAIVYCADFSGEQAVMAGATISNPTVISSVTGYVTVSNPQVLTTPFTEYVLNPDGSVAIAKVVAAGKGVSFKVNAVAKGTAKVTIQVQASDGQQPEMDVLFVVK